MNKNEVLAWLKKQGTQRNVDAMARYGIVAKHAFGVQMKTLLAMKKKLGKDHALSLALWESNWYEARLLAALVGDPQHVTRQQMNAWANSFENWADCDTACFHLFDRTPLAWERVHEWAPSPREFVKRGAFALMACLALHDKAAPDKNFSALLPLIENGARDERNFVKKGVSWAFRSIGRRNLPLNAASVKLARRLALSKQAASRWVGKDTLRELTSPKVQAQLARRVKAPPAKASKRVARTKG